MCYTLVLKHVNMDVIFVVIVSYCIDLAISESCKGLFFNSSASLYKIVYLYCSTGCCGSYSSQFCCSTKNTVYTEALSTAEIFGISFGVIIGTILFFGFCICVCRLCILPVMQQNQNNSGGTEMQTSGDISVITGLDTLPKYDDLPPSYEEAMSGTINFSFDEDPAYIPPTYHQQTQSVEHNV